MYQLLTSMINGYTTSYRGIPGLCWQRIIVSLIEAIVAGITFFLSLYFVEGLHFTIALAGVLITCYGIGTAVGGILGGKLSDKITPSIVSIIALALMGIAFLVLKKLSTPIPLAICLFFIGLAAYGFITSNTLWILNFCKQEEIRNRAINVIYAILNLGIGLGALLVSIVAKHGFSLLFEIGGILLLISAGYLLVLRIFTQNHIHTHELLRDAHETALTQRKRRSIALVVLGCVFLAGLFIAQLSTTYPLYIHGKFHHLGIKSVGILFMINAMIIVLFQAPINHKLSKYNKVMLLGVGLLLMGIGLWLLTFAIHYWIAIFACVVESVGDIMFFATAQLVCYQLGISTQKGHSIGLYRTTYATSMIIGPTVGALVYNHSNGDILWLICGIIGFVGLIACLSTRNRYRQIITK